MNKPVNENREWYVIDLDGLVLGRAATAISTRLMGKHKPSYSTHMDMGDSVVIINAGKVKVTGKKAEKKIYYKHSGYPGGFKEIKMGKLLEEKPGRVVKLAIRRMLPDNRLRRPRMARLKIYRNDKHPHGDKLEKNG